MSAPFRLREYRCYVPRLDTEAFYEAETPNKARYKCLLAIWDAGYQRPSHWSRDGDLAFRFKDVQVRLAYVNESVNARAILRGEREVLA